MLAAVVPARNEAGRIGTVLASLLSCPIQYIIPVLNGCTDLSLQEVSSLGDKRIRPIVFLETLGIDIPRAVGALYALKLGVDGIIFVDGDMTGEIQPHIACLIDALELGIDLALVNCYPYIMSRQRLASTVLHFRGQLNRELGVFKDLGLASPVHGPHAISRKLGSILEPIDFSVPPMVLVKAKQHNCKIQVVTSIPHFLLSSPVRERGHARKIAHTIIGDCLQALSSVKNTPVERSFGKHSFDGYHSNRRFDLLSQWQLDLSQNDLAALKLHLI